MFNKNEKNLNQRSYQRGKTRNNNLGLFKKYLSDSVGRNCILVFRISEWYHFRIIRFKWVFLAYLTIDRQLEWQRLQLFFS